MISISPEMTRLEKPENLYFNNINHLKNEVPIYFCGCGTHFKSKFTFKDIICEECYKTCHSYCSDDFKYEIVDTYNYSQDNYKCKCQHKVGKFELSANKLSRKETEKNFPSKNELNEELRQIHYKFFCEEPIRIDINEKGKRITLKETEDFFNDELVEKFFEKLIGIKKDSFLRKHTAFNLDNKTKNDFTNFLMLVLSAKKLLSKLQINTKIFVYSTHLMEILFFNVLVEKCSFLKLSVILNMNYLQRKHYLFDKEKEFNENAKEKREKILNKYANFFYSIAKFYKESNSRVKIEFSMFILPHFLKYCYYSIKYFIGISQKIQDNIFDKIFRSIGFFEVRKDILFRLDQNKFSPGLSTLTKLILVSLIYINDKKITEEIVDLNITERLVNTFSLKKSGSFAVFSKNSDAIVQTFLIIINKIETNNNKKSISLNFYVSKIMEIIMGDNNFCKSSIGNTLLISEHSYQGLSTDQDKKFVDDFNKCFEDLETSITQNVDIAGQMKKFLIQISQFFIKNNFPSTIVNAASNENKNELLVYNIKNFIKEFDTQIKAYRTDVNEYKNILESFDMLQSLIKYTNFFKIFTQIINNDNIRSDFNINFDKKEIEKNNIFKNFQNMLLLLLYIIVYKNNENVTIMMNFEYEKIINFFEEPNSDYDNFRNLLDFLLDVIKNTYNYLNSYRFDHFYFFISILDKMMEKTKVKYQEERFSQIITINENREIILNQKNIEELQKNIQKFVIFSNKCIKILIIMCKHVKINSLLKLNFIKNLLNVIESIFDNLHSEDLKNLNLLIKILMEIQDNKTSDNHLQRKSIQSFFKNYLHFLSEVSKNGLDFIGFLDKNELKSKESKISNKKLMFEIFNWDDIKEIIENKKIEGRLKTEFIRFTLMSLFKGYLKLKNKVSLYLPENAKLFIEKDTQPYNFFDSGVKQGNSNLVSKPVEENQNNDNNNNDQNKEDKKSEILLSRKIIYKILKLINTSPDIFNTQYNRVKYGDLKDSDKQKHINKLYLYEYCILRPCYLFINLSNKSEDNLIRDIKIFEMLVEKSIKYKDLLGLMDLSFNEFEENFLTNIEISLKNEELKGMLNMISENKDIKLLMDKLLNSFSVNLEEKILEEKPNETNIIIKELNKLYTTHLSEELDDKHKKIRNQAKKYLDLEIKAQDNINKTTAYQMKYILDRYTNDLESKYGEKLSLNRVLEDDSEYNFSLLLFEFFMKKLVNSEKKMEFNPLNIYCLSFLNNILLVESQKFQDLLDFSEYKSKFIKFFIDDMIFPFFLYETSKFLEIEDKYTTKNIINEILIFSLSIIKNLLEDNNKRNKTLLFDLEFDEKAIIKPNTITPISDNLNKSLRTAQSLKAPIVPQVKQNEIPKPSSIIEDRPETTNLTFVNFIFKSLRILLRHITNSKKTNSKISQNKFDFIYTIMENFNNLIIEMVEGTDPKNLQKIYSYPQKEFNNFNDICNVTNFEFFKLVKDIRNDFIKEELNIYQSKISYELEQKQKYNKIDFNLEKEVDLVDKENIVNSKILYLHFGFLKSLVFNFDPLGEQNIDKVKILFLAYPEEILLLLITKYLCLIYKKNFNSENPTTDNYFDPLDPISSEEQFFKKFRDIAQKYVMNFLSQFIIFKNNLKTTKINSFKDLFQAYIDKKEISEDILFKTASDIFIFISVLCDKYELTHLKKLVDHKECKKKTKAIVKDDKSSENIKKKKKIFIDEKLKDGNNDKEKEGYEFDIKSYIDEKKDNFQVIKFFNLLLRHVEFNVKKHNEEFELKRIYFLCHRDYYLTKEKNFKRLQEKINRTSATTKLRDIVKYINEQFMEINYVKKKLMKDKLGRKVFCLDKNMTDFVNFIFSISNIGILLNNVGTDQSSGFTGFVLIYEYLQIIYNIILLSLLILYKYEFYVKKSKTELKFKKVSSLNLYQKINLYFIKSFLLNEDFSFLIINIFICKSVLDEPGDVYMYCIQLVSILRYFPSAFEMAIVFKEKLKIMLFIFIFIIILVYFYTNLAFFKYTKEFVTYISEDETRPCNSLISCTIQMISGGGIYSGGLNASSTSGIVITAEFMERYFIDFIFFIVISLILANFLGGIIISTFAQIREDNKTKKDDAEKNCLICSKSKVEFDKRQFNFEDHKKYDHSLASYLKFFITYYMENKKDLNYAHYYIVTCAENNKINPFPINKSLTLGGDFIKGDDDSGDTGDVNQDEKEKNKKKKDKSKKKDSKKNKGKKDKAKSKNKGAKKGGKGAKGGKAGGKHKMKGMKGLFGR